MKSRWAWMLTFFVLSYGLHGKKVEPYSCDEVKSGYIRSDMGPYYDIQDECLDMAQALNDANEKRALRKILNTKGPQYQEWNSSAPTKYIGKYGWPDKTPTGRAK